MLVSLCSQVFEELLLDADWSVNAGSWMWLSCSSFFQQFFHCYCPVGFGRRTDPNGDYIRWVHTTGCVDRVMERCSATNNNNTNTRVVFSSPLADATCLS